MYVYGCVERKTTAPKWRNNSNKQKLLEGEARKSAKHPLLLFRKRKMEKKERKKKHYITSNQHLLTHSPEQRASLGCRQRQSTI